MNDSEGEFRLRGWPRSLDEFEGRMLYSLESYQIVEVTLRAYLLEFSRREKEGEKTIKSRIPKGMSLGELRERFELINKNLELHKSLRIITKDRNEIAHQGLVMRSRDIANLLGAEPMTLSRLREINRRALKVSTQVVCEFMKFSSGVEI